MQYQNNSKKIKINFYYNYCKVIVIFNLKTLLNLDKYGQK